MLFNSWSYLLIYSLIGTILYYKIKNKYNIIFLFLGSLSFYSLWIWEYTFLMILSATIDYIAGINIYKSPSKSKKKIWLSIAIATDLGILILFKYQNFILSNIYYVSNLFGLKNNFFALNLILPLGISFYTFQSMSYTIDVFRGIIKPEKNYFLFLTYVTFWPQLVAGPILRFNEVIPQIRQINNFNLINIRIGFELILVGLFKKVIIADNLSMMVDYNFSLNPLEFSAFDVWVSSFLFGYQIYFDFSGYSDIAIGSAKLLGINFPDNFNWPYLSNTPQEFWKRWHITLSAWIRDYLYLSILKKKEINKSSGGIWEHLLT